MLRKKMLAVAVATTLLAPAAFADSKNVDIYGVIAYGWMQTKPHGGDAQWEVLNESRIGFRGSKELKNGPKFIWQIESGFLGPNGLSERPWESGNLGTRDTWGGFEGGFGKIRFGRLLTPFGEVLDWPYANGGIGPVMEATNVGLGGSLVRVSDQFRWDSPGGGAVSGSISYGRGDRTYPLADLGNPWNAITVADSTTLSGAVHFKIGPATIHGAFEIDTKRTAGPESDATSYLLGYEVPIGAGFSSYGVVMRGKSEVDGVGEFERDTYQVALVYGAGDWIFKITHAQNGDQELDGTEVDEGGAMDAIQALYFLDPSAVAYARYVVAEDPPAVAWWNKSRILIGMEYYF